MADLRFLCGSSAAAHLCYTTVAQHLWTSYVWSVWHGQLEFGLFEPIRIPIRWVARRPWEWAAADDPSPLDSKSSARPRTIDS